MKTRKQSPALRLFTSIALLISLLASGGMVATSAQSGRTQTAFDRIDSDRNSSLFNDDNTSNKVSPDLREQIDTSGKSEFSMLGQNVKAGVASVLVQLTSQPSGMLNDFLNSHGIIEKKRFNSFNSRVLDVNVADIDELARFSEIDYISPDRNVEMKGHVESTTGAAAVRASSLDSEVDGTGVGIAILDSGMFKDHKNFLQPSGKGGRIVVNLDFTGGDKAEDLYGHGSHVAALAAGSSVVSSGAYTGVAPGATMLNLRVLDENGRGKSSSVLSALDWVLSNRATYNIRVVNMSLGALAIDSYVKDPLCIAVRRLVDAGIVCVAAAGNNGKDSNGNKVYGMIHSPGNEPSAITVGATNTYGTDARSDDTIATYSSRGPTRSYSTDQQGVKHFDNLLKPDLVAPGNRLISTEAKSNYLVSTNTGLDATSLPTNQDQMYLSGTSMATPIVAGAAALMLQANPSLTPNMVKAILMYTAQPLAGFNMLEQGAGEVNVEGAVCLAKCVRTNLTNSTPLGSAFLTTATPPTPQSTIAGEQFTWGQGIIAGYTYLTGANLITQYQKVYGMGILLGDGILLNNGTLLSSGTLLSNGILLGDNIMVSNGGLLGDGFPFIPCGILLGNEILLADGVLLGDGILLGDGRLLGDGILLGNAVAQSNRALVGGDDSPSMKPSP